MNGAMDLTEGTPEDLEVRIAETRASFDSKVNEIERRLSPREQVRRVRARLRPEPYIGIGVAAAVVTGAVLATLGWRRYRHPDNDSRAIGDMSAEEVTIDDLAPGPSCG
jgi:hypothetical protein